MLVFRILPFILIFKCLVNTTYSDPVNNSTINTQVNKTTEGTKLDSQLEVIPDVKKNDTAPIITEGGDRILSPENTTVESTTNHNDIKSTISFPTRKYGREGELVENTHNNTLNATIIEKTQSISTTETIVTESVIKPVKEISVTNDGKLTNVSRSGTVPRKGVHFTDEQLNTTTASITVAVVSSTTSKTTTVEPSTIIKQIHKPTITTGSEDNKDALVKEKSSNSTPKVPTIEYYQKTKEDNKRSTFIIPIVAVILSVPLVAIIVNILYKRGKEWWSHRHYRRMDFLIDGMYNN